VNVEPVYTLYNIRANKYCSVTNEQHLMDSFRTATRLWRCDPKTAHYGYAISIIHGAKTELRDFTTIFREFIRSEIEILFAQLINIHYIFAKPHVTRCRRNFISICNYVGHDTYHSAKLDPDWIRSLFPAHARFRDLPGEKLIRLFLGHFL